MFTQKTIAEAFGITKQAVNTALRGCEPRIQRVSKSEGVRVVTRRLQVYTPPDIFALAARTGKLESYRSLCEAEGVPAEAFHVTRKEVAFGDMLRRFLPDHVEIKPQHRLGRHYVDFYLPSCTVAIEYDERHHHSRKQTEADSSRQDDIQALADVTFVRVAEGREERGLFDIAHAILNRPGP